jgi:hypothetical protein
MCSGLTLMLVPWRGEPPSLNIALLAPFAAQGAALNLLASERAWCDGRGRFN